jgi:TIR domain
MSYVFISYSHKDSDYAHKLAKALFGERFPVWIDDRIDYGMQWPREIKEQLESCSAFIVIMSSHSEQSTWVLNELTRAQGNSKPIFPMLLEGNQPFFSVAATHYLDVRDGSLPQNDFYTALSKFVMRRAADAEVWDYAAQIQTAIDELGQLTGEIITALLKLFLEKSKALRIAQESATDRLKKERVAVNDFAESLQNYVKATKGKTPVYRNVWVNLHDASLGAVEASMVQKPEERVEFGAYRSQLSEMEVKSREVLEAVRKLRKKIVDLKGDEAKTPNFNHIADEVIKLIDECIAGLMAGSGYLLHVVERIDLITRPQKDEE